MTESQLNMNNKIQYFNIEPGKVTWNYNLAYLTKNAKCYKALHIE